MQSLPAARLTRQKKARLSTRFITFLKFYARLFSCIGNNRHKGTVFATFLELNGTVAEGKQRMVFAHTDVVARIVDSATLADDDVTGDAMLTAKNFNTQAFAFGFATVTGTTYTFFVSHNILFLKGFTILFFS